RSSLAFLLDIAGFAVRTHASAGEFLEIAPSITNGCLVTDLRMPDIDGLELLKRHDAMSAMLPTSVVTGLGDVQMAVEAMKSVAIHFFEKPFDTQMILDPLGRAADSAGALFELEQSRSRTQEAMQSLSERKGQVLEGEIAGQPNKVIA